MDTLDTRHTSEDKRKKINDSIFLKSLSKLKNTGTDTIRSTSDPQNQRERAQIQ